MKPFVFETIGQLAALGRRTGVAADIRLQLLRLCRMVAVADDLSDETAAF